MIFLDVETIPVEETFNDFLEAEKSDFKAPSSLTKTQACADMGVTGDDAKYMSKDDALAKWVTEFKDSKVEEVAREKWKKTSFDGGLGQLCSIAWAIDDDDVNSVSIDGLSEVGILEVFRDHLVGSGRRKIPIIFCGSNVRFDLKFLHHRFVVNGIDPYFELPFKGRHGQDFYCVQEEWAGYGQRISQNNMCKMFGLDQKPDGIDGSKVYQHFIDGNIKGIEEYNRYDVETVRKIYNRLNFKPVS